MLENDATRNYYSLLIIVDCDYNEFVSTHQIYSRGDLSCILNNQTSLSLIMSLFIHSVVLEHVKHYLLIQFVVAFLLKFIQLFL